MRRAAVFGVAAGVATAVAALVVSTAARCIDTPAYYNMWPLVSGSVGVAALVTGSLLDAGPRALRITLIGIGRVGRRCVRGRVLQGVRAILYVAPAVADQPTAGDDV